jgi:hypothetical protein
MIPAAFTQFQTPTTSAIQGTVVFAAGSGGGGSSITGFLSDLLNVLSGHFGSKVAQTTVSKIFSASAKLLLESIGVWVSQGALWLLDQVGAVMSASTKADIGSAWFGARLSLMSELAAAVVLPMLLCAVIQAIFRQTPGLLVRTVLVNLPLALMATGVAVELLRVGMAITDSMSAEFMAAAGVNTRNVLAPLANALVAALTGVPGFATFLASLVIAAGALVLWLELVVRASAITAAALFLPLVLAALVWPAISHWARRLADTLVALVLSKLVIAAIISLGAAAIDGGVNGSGSAGTRFGDVVVGVALLIMATLSPFTLLRLIPIVEAGAVSHLESAKHRLRQGAQIPVSVGGAAMSLVKGSSNSEMPTPGRVSQGSPIAEHPGRPTSVTPEAFAAEQRRLEQVETSRNSASSSSTGSNSTDSSSTGSKGSQNWGSLKGSTEGSGSSDSGPGSEGD